MSVSGEATEGTHMTSRMQVVETRLDEGDVSFHEVREHITEMRKAMEVMQKDTQAIREIVTAWNSIRGFVTTLRVIGGVLKWIATVGGILGAAYLFLKTGVWRGPK